MNKGIDGKFSMAKYDSPMARQARTIPALLRQQFADLEPKTRTVFTTEEIYSFQKIILTGCGDSFAACLAAKSAFERYARVPVEVVTTIDLARHYERQNLSVGPNSPLIIAVSNSGTVARLDEVVQRAHDTSAFTLGITKNPESPLGRHSSRILKLAPPKFEDSPGVGSYMISLVSLFLLAIRMGEVKLTCSMEEAGFLRSDIELAATSLETLLPGWEQTLFQVAERWRNFPGYDFVGSGSDYGSVFFGHAKIIEAVGRYAMHINTEEWLHLNFFLRHSETTGTVVFIDKNNAAMSRMKEVLGFMKVNRRPLLVITSEEKIDDPDMTILRYPDVGHGLMASLYQLIPVSLLAAFLSILIGEEYGRGSKGNWAFSHEARAVRESEIQVI